MRIEFDVRFFGEFANGGVDQRACVSIVDRRLACPERIGHACAKFGRASLRVPCGRAVIVDRFTVPPGNTTASGAKALRPLA